MKALLKLSRLSLSILLFAVCWLPPVSALPLPKDQKPPVPGSTGTLGEAQQPATTRPIPANPVRFGPDPNPVAAPTSPQLIAEPEYRSLAPNVIGATTVPFIDVQTGTVEFPFTNNYMRDAISVHLVGGNAQVHMAYPIYTGFNTSPWSGATADSLQSRIPLFYNSYNCGGSGTLDYPAPGLQMAATFEFTPPDDRLRVLGWGGGVLNFASPTQTTIVYGNRYVQRTDLGNFNYSFRGTGTIRDSAECAGRFSMDTTSCPEACITAPNTDPVMRAINDSVWVATYDGEDPNKVYFNYTTDRGQTWTFPVLSPMVTSWWNAVEIASNGGNVFYLTGMSDPANPTTFWNTERPCYVKGAYDPVSGSITLGSLTDITGDFELPAFLPIPHQAQAVMVGTTLHVIWTDWNNYKGLGFPGPGGHVHHAAVLADGTVEGPHRVANINIDGRLPDRCNTWFGFCYGPWGTGLGLSFNEATNTLYALWSQPREQYDVNGAPTYQWDDPWAGLMANFDIYYSASNNGGIVWDYPENLTDTKNPDCAGTAASPCIHEDYFAAYPEVINDTIWILSITRPKPGIRQAAVDAGISPDPGSFQMLLNKIRLYKAPARPACTGQSIRPSLWVKPGDTTNLTSMVIPPHGSHSLNMRFENLSCIPEGVTLDSLVVDPSLNEGVGLGFLQVTHTLNPGQFVPLAGFYDFTLTFDASNVGVLDAGARQGLIRLYGHTNDPSVPPPNNQGTALVAANVNVLTSYCLNRQIRIHSATNVTDVGTQGSIADEAGTSGLEYNAGASDASNRFYDGGVWIANSELNAGDCGLGPRKVTRQIFGDDFLRCIADGELDSVAIGGGRYNLHLRSVATDVGDSSLIWANLWEQSTHPDSSDWLIQNTRLINASENPIDSVAMGVLYDIDVFSDISQPARNVGGDSIILGVDGRSYHLGWIAGNDIFADTCTPNIQLYGFIVIPNPLSAPPVGDTVEPRLAVVYRATAFAYNLDCYGSGGDSLAQRWSWNVTGFHSPTNRIRDPNRGDDSLVWVPDLAYADTCLDGRLWRADMGYMTIAKKVYNFPTNIGAGDVISRYGLTGLAASVDSFFKGSGESYSVIHIGSITGLPGLIGNAQRAVKWFWNHAAGQAGIDALVPHLRGDLNYDRSLSGADIVAVLAYIFNGVDNPLGTLVPLCVADVNGDGAVSAADVVRLIGGTFNSGGTNPSPACPLCLTSCQ